MKLRDLYNTLHTVDTDLTRGTGEYGKDVEHGKGSEHLLKGRVLDVGCGRTAFLHRLKDTLTRATVTDISDVAIEYQKSIGMEAYQADIIDLPFEDKEFDMVTCYDVLEHLDPTCVTLAIGELARVADWIFVSVGEGSSPCTIDGETIELHLTIAPITYWASLFLGHAELVQIKGEFIICKI